jgi:phosphatidylserine/phosphatidylglycerophosphate/cardiolipin synthase-like enzyme
MRSQTPALIKTTLALFALIIVTSACSPEISRPTAPAMTSTQSPDADWYSVYFTDPTSPIASSYRGGPDDRLAEAIDAARLSVDVAVYDLNLWSIRDALVAAHRRGVTVRVVTESDNTDEQEIQDLKDAGIQVLSDRHEGLMHDKFVVIDRSEVWTGSMNFTTGGAYLDNNNLVRVRSVKLAGAYTGEFEQMFVDDRFGAEKTAQALNPVVTIDDSQVEVYFSPEDGTLAHILEVIASARENISFLAYSFTSDELAQALIDRAESGVTVQGVFDKDQYHANYGTEFDRLSVAGIDVTLDSNPRLMHDKVIIVDGQIVITGSYNFSNNAEYNNDENTLIIHNQEIAVLYLTEFERIFAESKR